MLDRPPHDGNLDKGSEGEPDISWAISLGIPPPYQYGVRGRTHCPPTHCITITSVFPHADQTIAAIYESKAVCHVYQEC